MMKTIIIYATHHGTTETVAHLIWSKLDPQNTELVNIKKAKHLDLNDYDVVIIGSSIHAGHNQNSIRNFCKKNMPELLEKHLGLFLCCMMEEEEATLNLQNAYPEILQNKAFFVQILGGEYKIEKMNYVERLMLKKIAGATESQSNIKYDLIDQFVQEIKTKFD